MPGSKPKITERCDRVSDEITEIYDCDSGIVANEHPAQLNYFAPGTNVLSLGGSNCGADL